MTGVEEAPRHDNGSRIESAQSPACKCHQNSGLGGRNLVVCIDGTANEFGEKNTNVVELYGLLDKKDRNQVPWYSSGIGTYAPPSRKSFKYYRRVIGHKIDLAIAWKFDRNIFDAYEWLSKEYREGDRIFLFGFSRGAFQVRVLAGMIDKVGLIYPGNCERQKHYAYKIYADPHSGSEAELFKNTFSRPDANVHFVGVWDTVSSVGFVRGKFMLPRTIDGMKHVCFFRHALALDERRVKFGPEYAYGGFACEEHRNESASRGPQTPRRNLEGCKPWRDWVSEIWAKTKMHGHNTSATSTPGSNTTLLNRTAPPNHQTSTADSPLQSSNTGPPDQPAQPAPDHETKTSATDTPPQTLEVWFAGTHSDIGGGNVLNLDMKRNSPPLRWMVSESTAAGLLTKSHVPIPPPGEKIKVIESLTGIWWLFECLPLKRLTYTRSKASDRKETTHKPHLGKPRKIHEGQKIHDSLNSTGTEPNTYTPKARPVDDSANFWSPSHLAGHLAKSQPTQDSKPTTACRPGSLSDDSLTVS